MTGLETRSTILVVDDEQTNVLLLERLLARHGYSDVIGLTDPAAVVPTFLERRPDLIILDLQMPVLDGFDVMTKLAEVMPAQDYVPILVLTANITPQTRLKALAQGAKDFVTKPFDQTEVLLRIKNLLETRHLHVQLRDANASLEEKVRERTSELELALDRLVRAERVRDEFVANTSHELRTPLVPIVGWADWIVKQDDLPAADVKEFARAIARSGNRLVLVVDSLLRVAAIRREETSPSLGTVDVRALLHEVEAFARTSQRELVVRIDEAARTAVADERYLREILRHLVDNAMRFSPDDAPIELEVSRSGDDLLLAVIDHGPGIAETALDQAFAYFEQLEDSSRRHHTGLGVGLYISRALVSAHGGRLWVDATPGGGATLRFTLPQT